MNDEKKPEEGFAVDVDVSDNHGAKLAVENYHFNVLEVVREAATRFKTQTGKDPKYLYGPEALFYLIDGAIKARAYNAGMVLPRGVPVVNVMGMDMIVVPGTCITVTAEALHDTRGTPPVIQNAPSTATVQ